jgi:hypothetical protein
LIYTAVTAFTTNKQNKKTFTMFTTLLSFDSSAIAANALMTCVDDSIACVLGTVAVGSLLALVAGAMAVVTVNASQRRQDAKGLVATSTTMSFSTTTTEDDDDECMPASDSNNEKSCRRVKKSVQFANTLVSSNQQQQEGLAWVKSKNGDNGWTQLRRSTRARRKPDRLTF